jgi:hypothetical protein
MKEDIIGAAELAQVLPKTRSGRLVKPAVAYWARQQIKTDIDGKVIGLVVGSPDHTAAPISVRQGAHPSQPAVHMTSGPLAAVISSLRGAAPTGSTGESVQVRHGPWQPAETAALEAAIVEVSPTAACYWHLVAQRVRTRTANQCFTKYHESHQRVGARARGKRTVHGGQAAQPALQQPSTTQTESPESPMAAQGTKKHRQQLRARIEALQATVVADAFDGTPLRNAAMVRPHVEISREQVGANEREKGRAESDNARQVEAEDGSSSKRSKRQPASKRSRSAQAASSKKLHAKEDDDLSSASNDSEDDRDGDPNSSRWALSPSTPANGARRGQHEDEVMTPSADVETPGLLRPLDRAKNDTYVSRLVKNASKRPAPGAGSRSVVRRQQVDSTRGGKGSERLMAQVSGLLRGGGQHRTLKSAPSELMDELSDPEEDDDDDELG